MSLHKYRVPPPLAVAVHPAPRRTTTTSKKDAKDATGKKDGKATSVNDEKDGEAAPHDKGTSADQDTDKKKANKQSVAILGDQTPFVHATPSTPVLRKGIEPQSPASNIPEPPTPAPGAEPPTPGPGAILMKKQQERREKERAARDEHVEREEEDQVLKDIEDVKKIDSKNDEKADSKDSKDEPEQPLEPLRLLSPAPFRPPRARLDLHPLRPYPPIQPDPRGAYHSYAKAVQAVEMYIDPVKDGWFVEQWRDRPEREALARLRGETERQHQREIEADKRARVIRPVPQSAEQIVLELWNDLVEAPNQEMNSLVFWGRYNWSDPQAAQHLADVPRKMDEKEIRERRKIESRQKSKDKEEAETANNEKEKNEGEKKEEEETKEQAEIERIMKEQPEPSVEWTKNGLEEILATVGLQCTFNLQHPVSRPSSYEPTTCFLLLSHGYFMIRSDEWLSWKPEKPSGKFEMLVATPNDRVFGEMIKAKLAEERKKKEMAYRARKAEEKKKKEEEERKKKEAGVEDVKEGKDEEEKKKKIEKGGKGEENDDEKSQKDGEEIKLNVGIKDVQDSKPEKKTNGTDSPASNVKVLDGEPIGKEKVGEDKNEVEVKIQPVDEQPANDSRAGVTIKQFPKDHKDTKDVKQVKHRAHKQHHPLWDAKAVAKMMGLDADGLLKMDDLKMAMRMMEMKAMEPKKTMSVEKKQGQSGGPLFWTWTESCEKWRWKNYEVGLHLVGPGGWEERDWREFSDGRGCDEFMAEMREEEIQELDLHDWSC